MLKSGSKYEPLYTYLRQRKTQPEIILTLDEIETILGDPLPTTARRVRGWWGNRSRGGHQSHAWMEAGFEVTAIDLEAGEIRFEQPGVVYHIRRDGEDVLWDGPLVRALRHQMGLSQTEFAKTLGVRQATVSEWETAVYEPTRSSSKLLSLIAEKAGFEYKTFTNESGGH